MKFPSALAALAVGTAGIRLVCAGRRHAADISAEVRVIFYYRQDRPHLFHA